MWRAWTLCRIEYPKMLTLSVWWLGITAGRWNNIFPFDQCWYSKAAAVADSATNMVQLVPPQGSNASSVIWAINAFNVTTLASSFLTNFLATSVVWHKTWSVFASPQNSNVVLTQAFYRNCGLLNGEYNRQTQKLSPVPNILLLLIDSGLIYCGIGVSPWYFARF